jgi:signal transduction histidine kinase
MSNRAARPAPAGFGRVHRLPGPVECVSAMGHRGGGEGLNGDDSFVASVIEALNHPFYVIDAETYVVKMANSAAYAGELPEGITCHALTHHQSQPCDRLGEVCPVAEIKRTKRPLFVEHVHHDPDGHWRAFEVRAFPILDGNGNVTAVIEYTLDVTERKEAEHVKGEFLSMVTHELRTPLHHIKGFATTLLQTDVVWDAATQRDFIGSISRETDRLSDLVEKILDLSRLEARAVPIEREWYQVADLINSALQRRRSLLVDRTVQLELGSNLPALFVDGREIEVVLVNLIENAVRYSKEGTPITIDARHQAGQMLITVKDQGIGIAADHRDRVFERFYRVPAGGRRPPGTGLGLAICKRIVEGHGGRIWVDSEPGLGSCFHVSLPSSVPHDPPQNKASR